MRAIVPVTPQLISCSIPEPDVGEAVYNPATTYALGATVISTTTHLVYESLQAGNTGNPLPVPPLESTDWWLEVGVTNRQAALDAKRSTQAVGTSPMVYVVAPNARINSIALSNMEAESARIEVLVDGVVVRDHFYDLNLRRVSNGYEYCFKPFGLQRSVLRFDLPPIFAAQVRVTLTRSTGQIKLGALDVGNYVYFGEMQKGAKRGALNFSEITRDTYGETTLRKRPSLPKTTQVCEIPKRYVTDVLDAAQSRPSWQP